MVFLTHDNYLASGTTQLLNNWVDPVYKFDSSSFYNWEQDNLPLYDLEDRDDYLYEMGGYPTSSVAGVMLTVSDCGIDNKKIFGTLSGAIEALPNTLRFPVTIEVAVSGDLGPLRLENIQIVGSGAGLEIINRGFVKVIAGPGTTSVSACINTTNGGGVTLPGSSITIFSSLDVSNTMYESSSLGASETVWVNSPDAANWWTNYTRTFVQAPEWFFPAESGNRTISISTNFADTNSTLMDGDGVGSNLFTVNTYTDNSFGTDTEQAGAGTGLQYADGGQVQRPDITPIDRQGRCTGFIYANSLERAIIKDCTGNIYIRGFCVDGASQAVITVEGSQLTDSGFDIQNSEVVIENCTASRCKNEGMLVVNSNVILNRGFIAFRNYELSSVGGVHLNTKAMDNPTAGLRAINSTVTLSSSTDQFKSLPMDSPFSFYRNLIGVDLKNSNLVTPADVRYGTNMAGIKTDEVYGSQSLVLQTFFNNFEGIKATDSLIDIGNRLSSFQNKVGMSLHNSVCKVSEISIDNNGREGLKAVNSVFNYNKNAQLINRPAASPWWPITNFRANGQHVTLDSSEFIPTYVSGTDTSMEAVYRSLQFSGNHGMDTRQKGNSGTIKKQTLPAVELTNNSYMNSVCSKSTSIGSTDVYGVTNSNIMQDGAIKGSAFRVVNNSNLELNGTRHCNNLVTGPAEWSKNQKSAALYAGNNSHIKIAGPTYIVQTGVDALAEDNSEIEFGPHTKNGIIDVSGWNLSHMDNQTKVDLHATRACLVANRKSIINMHDMGDYHAYWDPKYITNADYPTGLYDTSTFCSSGYMQFFPLPFVDYASIAGDGCNEAARFPASTASPLGSNGGAIVGYNGGLTSYMSQMSRGGMCVRAVGDSQVRAQNVRFPAAWAGGSTGSLANTSGPVYDASNTFCDLLRIWNIADNSELHASYLSVGTENTSFNGTTVHPQDASGYYFGPSAVWSSGLNSPPLSAAPSSTADTSSLSILDSFGSGVPTGAGLGYYGKGYGGWTPSIGPENIGPFRLYVSTDAIAKFLAYPVGPDGSFYPSGTGDSMGFNFPDTATLYGHYGTPSQLFAQGYATSSDCSATNNQGLSYLNPSTVYQDLGFSGHIVGLPVDQQGTNPASSFFYTSAMLPNDSASRIWLDESAINTFANAKNGLLATSGRKKIFSYYNATTAYPGEGFVTTPTGKGRGLRSTNLFDLDRDL